MQLIKRLWSILRTPTAFFKTVAHEPVSASIKLFLIVLVIATIIGLPASYIATQFELDMTVGEWLPQGLLMGLLGLVQGIVGYAISIGIVHIFVRLFHGKGLIRQTAKTFLYPTAAVQALLIPFTVLYQIVLFFLLPGFTMQQGLGGMVVVGLLYGLIALALGIMAFVSTVQGIKLFHSFTTGKAVAVILLPVLIFAVLAVIGMLIIAMTFGPTFGLA